MKNIILLFMLSNLDCYKKKRKICCTSYLNIEFRLKSTSEAGMDEPKARLKSKACTSLLQYYYYCTVPPIILCNHPGHSIFRACWK